MVVLTMLNLIDRSPLIIGKLGDNIGSLLPGHAISAIVIIQEDLKCLSGTGAKSLDSSYCIRGRWWLNSYYLRK